MRLTATAVTQSLLARIQVKTYPFSSILRHVASAAQSRLTGFGHCASVRQAKSTGLFPADAAPAAISISKRSPIGFLPVGLLFFAGRIHRKTRSNCRFGSSDCREKNGQNNRCLHAYYSHAGSCFCNRGAAASKNPADRIPVDKK